MKIKKIIDRKFIELTGCIHNHSEYSFDSKTPIKNILDAANANDLDYLTINDHMTLAAKDDEAIKNENDLMVIVGAEINDSEQNNHYLVFNVDKILQIDDARAYVKEYQDHGAIGFAAHPHERRKDDSFRKYLWTDKENIGFDGLEVWNFLSEWVSRLQPKINGLWMVLFPWVFVPKPYRKNLIWWDELNNRGLRKSGIGSVDCHEESHKKFFINFKFLLHKNVFKTIRTNVLIQADEEINQMNVLKALKRGNSYIVNYRMGTPYNFYFAVAGNGKGAIAGEEIAFSNDLVLYYRLPRLAKVHIFRNGKKIFKKYDEKGELAIKEKGNYRLEVTSFGRGWIYTNNIYIK